MLAAARATNFSRVVSLRSTGDNPFMLRTHQLVDGSPVCADGILPPGWIHAQAPDDAVGTRLETELGLHPLALEDALRRNHPPKLEEFDDYVFLIVHTPDMQENEPDTRKLSIFLGKDWICSIARRELAPVADVWDHLQRQPALLKEPARIAYLLIEGFASGFEKVIDGCEDRIADLEARVLSEPDPDHMTEILRERQQISFLTRIMRGQRDMCAALSRCTHRVIPKKAAPYWRDLFDHANRVTATVESAREALAAVRDAHLAAANNRLSETMRVLTIIATVMMPLSLIAGVYGMNFRSMPGSDSPAGFWLTVGAMLAVASGMLCWFRKRKWL